MDLPEWHDTDYAPEQVTNLREISGMGNAPAYDALRSYATGRREHALYGPMPAPVARISNRRLWLREDVRAWLTCPLPRWRRNRSDIRRWIAAGRPRELPDAGATMPVDGRTTPAA